VDCPERERDASGDCTKYFHAHQETLMPIPKHLGRYLLAAWLVLTGLIRLIEFSFKGLGTVMALLAIAAGVLIVLDRE
jgi:hypothetical protein